MVSIILTGLRSGGYTFGMKTAISIPDDVFEQAERFARHARRSRSQVYSEAIREYVARHSPDAVTEAMNRVCDEIETAHVWDVMGRGIESMVITDLAQAWGSSESCTSCGKCVNACPTGALFEKGKSVAEMAKNRQFLTYIMQMREHNE